MFFIEEPRIVCHVLCSKDLFSPPESWGSSYVLTCRLAELIVKLIVLGKCDDFLAPTLHHCSLSPYSSSSLFPTFLLLLGYASSELRLFLLSNRVRNCTLGRWWIMISRMWKVGTILDTQILQMMPPLPSSFLAANLKAENHIKFNVIDQHGRTQLHHACFEVVKFQF